MSRQVDKQGLRHEGLTRRLELLLLRLRSDPAPASAAPDPRLHLDSDSAPALTATQFNASPTTNSPNGMAIMCGCRSAKTKVQSGNSLIVFGITRLAAQ